MYEVLNLAICCDWTSLSGSLLCKPECSSAPRVCSLCWKIIQSNEFMRARLGMGSLGFVVSLFVKDKGGYKHYLSNYGEYDDAGKE